VAVISEQRDGPSFQTFRQWRKAELLECLAYVWFGLLAPAQTPEPVIAKLNTAVNEGLKLPEYAGKHR